MLTWGFPVFARQGSLVIESEAVVNNETHPDAASDLSVALIDLNQGQLTVGNQTGDVGLTVGGVVGERIFFLFFFKPFYSHFENIT